MSKLGLKERKRRMKLSQRKYYVKNRERILARDRKYRETHVVEIRARRRLYSAAHKVEQRAYRLKHQDRQRAYMKKYRRDHPEQYHAYGIKYREYDRLRAKKGYHTMRLLALRKVARGSVIQCSNCDCDNVRLIEINHKNGGGCRESRKGRLSFKFYRAIMTGKRKINDLNLLCKVCNALEYVERNYADLRSRFTVVWTSPQIKAL